MRTFEEVYETLPADGWLSKAEAELLWYSVPLGCRALEVGCYQGRATVLIAARAGSVACVDPFDGFHSDLSGPRIRERFASNLRERGIGNVVLYPQRIEEWQPFPMDFAYLDGDHTYQGTIDQIKQALRCSPRSVAVHDVNDSGGGSEVKRAAMELLGGWSTRVERLAVWLC